MAALNPAAGPPTPKRCRFFRGVFKINRRASRYNAEKENNIAYLGKKLD
jgi:hypothetical protein